jgi:methionyl-tRNA formyltransferase
MRAVIFTDVQGSAGARLIPAAIRCMRERGDIRLCGLVTSRPARFRSSPLRRARRSLRAAIVAATNRAVPQRELPTPWLDLERVARTERVPLLVPPDGDINEPAFIERMVRELHPTVAFSVECLGVFRAPLLAAFEQAVNYHAGLCPHYRGVMATGFSILRGEVESGFTFHRMTERIDGGPILVEGCVPIGNLTVAEVGRRKLDRAVQAIPQVLAAVAAREPGRPQGERGNYFSALDWEAMIRIEHPELLTAAQIAHRLRAFGALRLTIAGVEYPVTRLRSASPGEPRSFGSIDGALLTPDRYAGLPWLLHRLARSRTIGADRAAPRRLSC